MGGGEIVKGYQSEIRQFGGQRKFEIVSSKVHNPNHLPITLVRSLPPAPPTYVRPEIYDFDKIRDSTGKRRGGGGLGMCFTDPEMQRRRRVAKYKAYSAEGKLKMKFRKGWKWVKNKCRKVSMFMESK